MSSLFKRSSLFELSSQNLDVGRFEGLQVTIHAAVNKTEELKGTSEQAQLDEKNLILQKEEMEVRTIASDIARSSQWILIIASMRINSSLIVSAKVGLKCDALGRGEVQIVVENPS